MYEKFLNYHQTHTSVLNTYCYLDIEYSMEKDCHFILSQYLGFCIILIEGFS